MVCFLSADFFSAMYQLSASTSQKSASCDKVKQSEKDTVKQQEKERKVIKTVWLGKSPSKPSLTHETIKSQIGNCTICFRLPKPDCIQLNLCGCVFCRNCFCEYLDNFSTPNPVIKKVWISKDPDDYKDWNKTKCAGFFDANLLSSEGTILPKQVNPSRPKLLVKASWLDGRSDTRRRIRRKVPDDQNWYRIVKNERFTCPNCHHDYDMNRDDLKRNRTLSDILQKMLENEPRTQLPENV